MSLWVYTVFWRTVVLQAAGGEAAVAGGGAGGSKGGAAGGSGEERQSRWTQAQPCARIRSVQSLGNLQRITQSSRQSSQAGVQEGAWLLCEKNTIMQSHCNEHGHTQRVPWSLLLIHSNHIYAVSESSVTTQRNTLNVLFPSHLRAAKTSWDMCWRKPRSVTRQRSVRPSAHTPHTLLESAPLPSSPVPHPAAGLTAQRKQGECSESLAKLQKKNQELQRHLEKACRQLQKTVREHKSTLQKMKGAKRFSMLETMGTHDSH